MIELRRWVKQRVGWVEVFAKPNAIVMNSLERVSITCGALRSRKTPAISLVNLSRSKYSAFQKFGIIVYRFHLTR